jgi:hypothetical protein
MKPARLAGLLVASLVITLGARDARAQSYQTSTAIASGAVFGAVDLALFAYDLAMAERNKEPSRTVVWLEVAASTLQLGVGISMLAVALQSDDRVASQGIDRDLYIPVGALLTTVAVPLFVHGVRHGTARTGGGMHTLRVVPTRVGDVRAGGPGLVLAGRF